AVRWETRPARRTAAAWVPSTTTLPAVGRSIPPIRFRRVVFPHPEGPWSATSSPSPTCMSRPRSAITSVFPARYTLMRSFVTISGVSTTSDLEDARDVHPGDPGGHRQRGEEHGPRSEEDEEEGLGGDDHLERHEELPGSPRPRGDELGAHEGREGTHPRPHEEADEHDREGLPEEEARDLRPARAPGSGRRHTHIPPGGGRTREGPQ